MPNVYYMAYCIAGNFGKIFEFGDLMNWVKIVKLKKIRQFKLNACMPMMLSIQITKFTNTNKAISLNLKLPALR